MSTELAIAYSATVISVSGRFIFMYLLYFYFIILFLVF
jgi:hypothetical protein